MGNHSGELHSARAPWKFCILSPLLPLPFSAPPENPHDLTTPSPSSPLLRAQGNVTQISTRLRPSRRTPPSSLPLSSPRDFFSPRSSSCVNHLFFPAPALPRIWRRFVLSAFYNGVRCWFRPPPGLFSLFSSFPPRCRQLPHLL